MYYFDLIRGDKIKDDPVVEDQTNLNDEYLTFRWETGILKIKGSAWNRLSQKKKNLILKLCK